MNLPKLAEGTTLFLSRPLSLFGMALDTSIRIGETLSEITASSADVLRIVVTSTTDRAWAALGFQKRPQPDGSCPLGCPHRNE